MPDEPMTDERLRQECHKKTRAGEECPVCFAIAWEPEHETMKPVCMLCVKEKEIRRLRQELAEAKEFKWNRVAFLKEEIERLKGLLAKRSEFTEEFRLERERHLEVIKAAKAWRHHPTSNKLTRDFDEALAKLDGGKR